MSTYDAVFVGAGHNALIAAAYLARRGWSVLVLERNDRPGGFVRCDELTLPGFSHDTFSSAHPLLVSSPVYAELGPELEARGLSYVSCEFATGVSLESGASAVLVTDTAANAEELERVMSGEGEAWLQMIEGFAEVAEPLFGLLGMDLATPAARPLLRRLMLTDSGLPSRFAGELTRTGREVLCERFRSPVTHALLAPWLSHCARPIDQAGGAPWLALTMAALEQGGYCVPVGGSEQLAIALARLVEDHGGEIRCDSPVEEIVLADGAASGVLTHDGEAFAARRAVIASTAPDQLYLRLLASSAGAVSSEVRRQARRFRYGAACVQVHLALSGPARFADERLARTGGTHLTPGLDAISRSVNEGLRGLLPAVPTIALDMPTIADPTRVPRAGQAVARLQILDLPPHPRGDAAGEIDVGGDGWTPAVLERFADRVVKVAGRHIPGLEDGILGRAVIGPREIAAFNPNAGPGDPYGGSHDLSQSYLLRPLAHAPGHATPVPRLHMLGAATWPGHGVSGGSGRIVAQALLAAADRG